MLARVSTTSRYHTCNIESVDFIRRVCSCIPAVPSKGARCWALEAILLAIYPHIRVWTRALALGFLGLHAVQRATTIILRCLRNGTICRATVCASMVWAGAQGSFQITLSPHDPSFFRSDDARTICSRHAHAADHSGLGQHPWAASSGSARSCSDLCYLAGATCMATVTQHVESLRFASCTRSC